MDMNFNVNEINSQTNNYYNNESDNETEYFPRGYVPRDKDVIVGKGMKCYTHAGNEMFRHIVNSRLQEYAATKTKKGKSDIISSVVDQVCMNGCFVKKDSETGLWFKADDVLARDKTSQAFRNTWNAQNKQSSPMTNPKQPLTSSPMPINSAIPMYDSNDIDNQNNYKRMSIKAPSYLPMEISSNDLKEDCEEPLDWRNSNYKLFSSSLNVLDLMSSKESIGVVDKLATSLPARMLEDDNPYEPIRLVSSTEVKDNNMIRNRSQNGDNLNRTQIDFEDLDKHQEDYFERFSNKNQLSDFRMTRNSSLGFNSSIERMILS